MLKVAEVHTTLSMGSKTLSLYCFREKSVKPTLNMMPTAPQIIPSTLPAVIQQTSSTIKSTAAAPPSIKLCVEEIRLEDAANQ